MKDIIENNKLIITIILKNIVYLCWFSYAVIMSIFIHTGINDNDIIYLGISFLIIYFIRGVAKSYYRKLAHNSYYEFKHNIEMLYYKRLNKLSMNQIDEMEKEYVADKILEVSYNSTRLIMSIGEYIIPTIIGLLVLYIKLFSLNYIVASIVLLLLIGVMFLRHKNTLKQDLPKHNNYNDLLKNLVLNIKSIKKLNVFDFTAEELDNYRDNDLVILKNTDEISDINFNNATFVLLTVMLISTFLTVEGTITRLGVIIYIITVMLKLQDLLFQISPSIINYKETKKNKILLDSYFKETTELKYENKFKKITVTDGVVKYKSGISIKIPILC